MTHQRPIRPTGSPMSLPPYRRQRRRPPLLRKYARQRLLLHRQHSADVLPSPNQPHSRRTPRRRPPAPGRGGQPHRIAGRGEHNFLARPGGARTCPPVPVRPSRSAERPLRRSCPQERTHRRNFQQWFSGHRKDQPRAHRAPQRRPRRSRRTATAVAALSYDVREHRTDGRGKSWRPQ